MGRGSGGVVCAALGANVALAVAHLVAQWRLYEVLGRMRYGEPVLRAEMWVGNLSGIQMAACTGAGVLLVGWFVETRHHIALDLRGSDRPQVRARRRTRFWAVAWSVGFVSWTVAGRWTQNLYRRAEQAEAAMHAVRAGMLTDLLGVLAGLAAIAFVWRLSRSRFAPGRTASPAVPA
ncbi:hypothetical protein GCM10011579_024320 [Streptomyces albiflavescens]|uniref:DUF4328 domain-containing protein n=1 Tax=Streptomyces albiflavescens TaxID=1623582 RepID=A0A918D2S5_9ACTN|nr:hypothetical protein [Streptomyces albiflavescens]GGN59819.1 hypothetical protein GCM10011579_024320 [Streptomyces albiflavescens]